MSLELNVYRKAARPTYTIGHMYLNYGEEDQYFCDTLEDTLRIPFFKIPDMTAIRSGRYLFTLEHDVRPEKHGALRPYLHDVEDYTGIEIHSGATDKDTEGCILVGKNTIIGMLTDGLIIFPQLLKLLQDSGQTEWYINIFDPEGVDNIGQTETRPHK